MKNFILILCSMMLNIYCSFSQITVDHVYTVDPPRYAFKLSSGLKYCAEHSTNYSLTYFVLYNPDHSVYRTINVPQVTGKKATFIAYVSDALFDTDTLIEYMLLYQSSTMNILDVAVCNELGNTLLYVDSANFVGGNTAEPYMGHIIQPIFPDGNQTKLYLYTNYYGSNPTTTVYNLPGQLTCLECNNGFVSGIALPPNVLSEEKSQAYPNPSSDYIKIKYSLPETFHHAFVNLYDVAGKLIKQKEIDRYYDDVYISTEEMRQGVYSYEIVADDNKISSGKIVKL